MVTSRLGPLLAISLPIVLAASAPPAFAQAEPPASDADSAEALFQSALAALDQGDWAAACPKFELSMKLDPAVGTLIHVARCHEHAGRVGSAWAKLGEALALNRTTADPSRQQALEELARKTMSELEPRLPRLRIVVDAAPPGLVVTRNGERVPAGAVGEAIPVDPGAIEVIASAPGYRDARWTGSLREGERGEATLALTALETTAEPAPPLVPPPPPDTASAGGGPDALLVAGLVTGGVGVVGLVVGTITGLSAKTKADDLEARCPVAASCDAQGVEDAESGSTLAGVSTVAFIAGGVLTAAGVTMTLTSVLGRPDVEATAAATPTGGRLSVEARF